MKRPLIRSKTPVALIGAGPVGADDLDAVLGLAPDVVAVDGGVHHLSGRENVLAVIGDMDSIAPGWRPEGADTVFHRIAEQDSTDLEKCLHSVRAPLMLGAGFLGGRIDHHLAAMNALARYPDKTLLLLGEQDICFHCPPKFEIDLEPGTRVSLFPMHRVEGVLSHGLRWPVKGLTFRPSRRIGTSNQATGGPLRLGFHRPGMLVILPRECLAPVFERLHPGVPGGK